MAQGIATVQVFDVEGKHPIMAVLDGETAWSAAREWRCSGGVGVNLTV
jgi:hypothetical protein